MLTPVHKAGFVAILGKPNAGKSTLMNHLVGASLAITHAKAQTTRHQLYGIVSKENFQIIYIDTPGIIIPAYPLQKAMMETVALAYRDADVIISLIDAQDETTPAPLPDALAANHQKTLLVLNKIDLLTPTKLDETIGYWSRHYPKVPILSISALNHKHTPQLIEKIVDQLPQHPPYYPKESLTDKPERFFAREIIREKILDQYHQEIPYSTEVVIDTFKEMENLIQLSVIIHVERPTQKGILIGHRGNALKQLGIAAREKLETFFQKRIFLTQHIKVTPNWRKNTSLLKKFGYHTLKEEKKRNYPTFI